MTRLNRKRRFRVIQGGKRDLSPLFFAFMPWVFWLELMGLSGTK